MKKLDSIFNASIPRNSLKREATLAVVIGLSIFLILAVFQPFGTYNFQSSKKMQILFGYGLLAAILYFSCSALLPLVFANFYRKDKWVLWRELLHYAGLTFLTLSFLYLYKNVALDLPSSFEQYIRFLGLASAVAIFPIIVIALLRYVQIKLQANPQLPLSFKLPQTNYASIKGDNKTEKLTIDLEELLYVQAADNYVSIHLIKEGGVERHLFRCSLRNFMSQISDPRMHHVHRSYYVNTDFVASIIGKSPNYELLLSTDELRIPVSRSKITLIREQLSLKPI